MSEESKTAEGDYVMMGAPGSNPGAAGAPPVKADLNLDDPNLTQEEKDHRLAVALQQQENAAAYDQHKKRHEEIVHASQNRTARSGTFTKLAAVRKKDHGMLSVPDEYTSEHAYHKSDGEYVKAPSGYDAPPPGATQQEIEDWKLAAEMQKVEQVDAGTVRTMQKIVTEEQKAEEEQAHRTGRSTYHINQKGLMKH